MSEHLTRALIEAELAERRRMAEHCALVAAARPPRVPWRVRLGLGLIALGRRLGGELAPAGSPDR